MMKAGEDGKEGQKEFVKSRINKTPNPTNYSNQKSQHYLSPPTTDQQKPTVPLGSAVGIVTSC